MLHRRQYGVSAMPAIGSLTEQRVEDLFRWTTDKALLPGLEHTTYLGILDYVLWQQNKEGFWTIEGTEWKVVMTAVVLKALAALQFGAMDKWSIKDQKVQRDGGIQSAINFLIREVESKGNKLEVIGEDIWDTCQVCLALAKFGNRSSAVQLARKINNDWSRLFDNAIADASKNRWCGPAYLAAIVEVIGCYEEDLDQSQFALALNHLMSLEEKGGGFQATIPRDDIDLWATSLVLRALSKVSKKNEALFDRALVQRLAQWLLVKRRASSAWNTDKAEAPMFLSRCLHGLVASRRWVDTTTRELIDVDMKVGNERLTDFFINKPERLGNLKAYTAVLEYLADLTIPAPAGLLCHFDQKLFPLHIVRPQVRSTTDPRRTRSDSPYIFISHRHKELRLVEAIVDLLEAAFRIQKDDIRCTSVQPFTIQGGIRISDRLKKDIAGSKVVLSILTPETKESSYVLFELGASWGLGILTLPLLAKGVQPRDVPDLIGDHKSLNLNKRDDCHQLLQNLASITGLSQTTGYEARISDRIDTVIKEAKALPPRAGKVRERSRSNRKKGNKASASQRS